MIGTILSGSIIEKIGCLWTLRLGMMCELGGWACIIAGQFAFNPVIVGRILSGFGCGLTLPAAYMLLSDVSLVRFRGIFAVLNSSSCNVGFLIGLVVGAWCTFPVILVSCITASVSFLIISIFLPESPLWLIKKGQDEKALKIIERIRGNNYPAHVEAKEISACVNTDQSNEPFLKKILKDGMSRPFLQPLSIMLVIATVQGLSGVDAISYYCVTIFKMANLAIDPYTMAIFMQIGYTAGYIMIAPFMDSIDRKKLYIIAGNLMIISLVILGATISPEKDGESAVAGNTTNVELGNVELGIYEEEVHISGVKSEKDENGWYDVVIKMAPCVSVVLYTFSYGAGCGPAIYTWTSELFPSKLKGVGSSIALASRNVVVFIVLKFYPTMIDDLGLSKIFWMHAGVMFIGNIFVFFVMPETRGLTMTQLNEMFGGKISYHKRNTYDIESIDEQEENLTCNKERPRRESSKANIVVSRVAATAALSKVASAAAMSRVASLARSVGGMGKDNEDEYDVKLLQQQSSSEESSESELDRLDVTRLENRSLGTIDCDSDDGMTMSI